ncbi:MAG: diaminopimelate epimerase [Bacteroidales bacterium]
MTIHAYKYQGAGNDFVILDNRNGEYNLTPKQINFLCDRRFGIGADGLMLLGKSDKHNFSMQYYNANGYESTMCGNGGRCLVAFAAHLGIKKFEFNAIDGYHIAEVLELTEHRCIVKLKMINLGKYDKYSQNAYFMNTGSPHYVEFVENVSNYPVDEKGKYWRYHKDFEGGTNVNFVEITNGGINVRTYERGVEAETYACGTGVTASAIATFLYNSNIGYTKKQELENNIIALKYNIHALGDTLSVSFKYNKSDKTFLDIFLTGPATFVFDCLIKL